MWILAVVLAILLVFFWTQHRYSQQRRVNLTAYATYLLLDPAIHRDHAAKLREFIGQQGGDAMTVTGAAFDAIFAMSEQLAQTGSTLKAHTMITQVRKGVAPER
jgi:hypothetical protein